MKIASLSVKDFRSYEEASIGFTQPLTIIKALNGKGKTSLQQAIELALTRSTDGVDPRGAGANTKIRNGAKKALIDVALDTKSGPINVKATYGPNKTGRGGSINPPDFERFMDANKERLSCVLNTRYFTGLNQKDQSGVLAGLVLPTTYNFDANMTLLAEKHLGQFQWTQKPVAIIDQVYSLAYDARKTAKATMAAIYIPREPAKPEHTSAAVQKELNALRSAASKETKALKGGGSAQVGKLEAQIEAALTAKLKFEEGLALAKESYGTLAILGGDAVKKHQKIAAGRRIFDDLQGKISQCANEIAAQEQAKQIYLDLLEEPFCPTCTQAITHEFINSKVGEHEALRKAAIEEQRGYLKEQQALGDIASSERALAGVAEAEQKSKSLGKDVESLESEVNQKGLQITNLKMELEDAKQSATAPPDTSALDSLNAQIATWESLLGPATTYEATLETITRETKRHEEQKQVVADLETLCAYFGKDGIKAKLIQEHIETFSATVNSVLQVWGFTAAFSFDPYQFLVTGDKGTLPLSELSGGETFMFCAALQCAIAIHSKIKMVLIDEADTLVDAARSRLFKCIKGLLDSGALDQAIILEASADINVPKKEGVSYFRVADGKVEGL